MLPLYEYETDDGDHIEIRRPVKDRNKPLQIGSRVYRRSKDIPDNVAVVLPGPTEDQAFNAKVRKGYYDREQKLGSRFKDRHEGLTKKQLADLWSDTGK